MSRPGMLRRFGLVRRPTLAEAGGGTKSVSTPTVEPDVWFAAEPVSSSQRLQAGAEHRDITHVVTWRALGTLLSGDQFVDAEDGKVYTLKEPPRDVGDMGRYEQAFAVREVA